MLEFFFGGVGLSKFGRRWKYLLGELSFQGVTGTEIHLLGNLVFKVWSVLKSFCWGVGFSKFGGC